MSFKRAVHIVFIAMVITAMLASSGCSNIKGSQTTTAAVTGQTESTQSATTQAVTTQVATTQAATTQAATTLAPTVSGNGTQNGNTGVPGPGGKLLFKGVGGTVEYTGGSKPVIKFIRDSDQSVTVVCDDMPSRPVLSPDGKTLAYLAPYQFEVLSDIKFFDLQTGTNSTAVSQADMKKIQDVRKDNTAKSLMWLDDRYLVAIVQYGFGTVIKGGDLFVYDMADKSLRPLTKLYEREEITGMSLGSKYLNLDTIEFTDENMNDFSKFKKFAPIGDIYSSIVNYRLAGFYDEDNLAGYESYLAHIADIKFDPGKAFQQASADLDGDGKADSVKLQFTDDTASEFVLTVNDQKITGSGENIENKINIVDIDTSDKYKEIAIQEDGPSDDYLTHFYFYDGNKLQLIGLIDGLCADKAHTAGNGTVVADERAFMLQTWFYAKNYKLDPNHQLRGVKAEFYPVLYAKQTLKVQKQMHLYTAPLDGASAAAVLKPGDSITLLGCDSIEWCYAQTASGIKGWFAVDMLKVRELGLDSSDVFQGLSFAD